MTGVSIPIPSEKLAVSSRFLDFWLLGGASILFFVLVWIASLFRADSTLVQQKFFMLGSLFALASAVCNHPHFIIGYRFAYTRGWKFLFKYWFSLIVVPVLLILAYVLAYRFFDQDLSASTWVINFNQIFSKWGVVFHFGESQNLGLTLLSLTILLMYCTVGWHYSKQVYGCMMVYNHYDQFGLSKWQKLWIKYSLLLLATYQFFYLSSLMDQNASVGYQDPRFPGIQLISLGLSDWFLSISQWTMIASFLGTLGIFVFIYKKTQKLPSPVFLVAWLAIYVWWIQIAKLPEYYYMAVPFFHSLQYLPFAAKVEKKKIPRDRYYDFNITTRVLGLLLIGVMIFEYIPTYLDFQLETNTLKTGWFFMIAFAIGINIHHFFIDSTIWRLEQKEVKNGILV